MIPASSELNLTDERVGSVRLPPVDIISGELSGLRSSCLQCGVGDDEDVLGQAEEGTQIDKQS